MRKNIVLYILFLFALSGCNHRPFSVMSHDKMVDVLFDVHLAEATINALDPYAQRIEKQEYYNSVFEKHNITKEDFDKSLDWYSRHPKKMLLLYDDLKVRVDKRKEDIENYVYHPELKPTHNDSIDTFDIWCWKRALELEATDSNEICWDSIHYMISNKEYLEHSEEIRFYLKMTASSATSDSLKFVTRLIYYTDTIQDTLECETYADSICRRYRLNKIIPDSIEIDSLNIELVDTADGISYIKVDSIELLKVYNNYENPISYRIRNSIRDAQNSAEADSKDKEKEKDSKREVRPINNLRILQKLKNK